MWDGDLTGEVVDDRYALGSLYGSGGMAEVYRAVDTRLDRKVAIKFFLGEPTGEDRIRLDREAQVLGGMRFPGLVEVYGAGSYRGRPFYVMQPVDGGTLRRRMRGAMSPEVVASIGSQIAGVLAHVHANDVVHRDVKPSNILLDPAGRRAYLADFGLALQAQATRVTKSGILVGTAGYLAPEQVRGGDVLPAADVYALGLVLLECLTGRPEYPGGDTEAALSRLHREPRVPANLPGPWVEVLTAMTASDPARRPAAAECERLLAVAQQASAGLAPLVEVAVVDRPAVGNGVVGDSLVDDGLVVGDGPVGDGLVGGGPVGGGPVVVAEPKSDNRVLLFGAAAAAVTLTLVGFLAMSDPFGPGSGDRAVRPATTTAGEPVAEQAPGTNAVVPGDPSTVTVVQGAAPQQQPAGDPGGGTTDDAASNPSTTTTTSTTTKAENPVRIPSNAPVVIVPTPHPPTVVTGPPSKERGSRSGRS